MEIITPQLLVEDRAFAHMVYQQAQALQKLPVGEMEPLASTIENRKSMLRAIQRKFASNDPENQFKVADHISLYTLHAELCSIAKHVATKAAAKAYTRLGEEIASVSSRLDLSDLGLGPTPDAGNPFFVPKQQNRNKTTHNGFLFSWTFDTQTLKMPN